MSTTWDDALDALEAEARSLAAFAADPGGDPVQLSAITVDGPIPSHLVPRAIRVQRAFDDAVAALEQARCGVGAELATWSRRDDAPVPARYIDTSA